jgi:hypothetical protein
MTTTTTHYTIQPLTAAEAEALRSTGGERYVADEKPGFPCRRCLRDAEIGDELILVSHDPFQATSPYRSASPIFLHVNDCTPAGEDTTAPPEQLTVRQLSVRGYDRNDMMHDAMVIDGSTLDTTIQALFENDGIDHLHVHMAARGCYAARIVRADQATG